MRSPCAPRRLAVLLAGLTMSASIVAAEAAEQPAKPSPAPAAASAAGAAQRFDTPQQAADALVDAAAKFDVPALERIFGSGQEDVVLSGEYAQDRKIAEEFVAQAREEKHVSVDPKSPTRAFLVVGKEDWPFPVPLVKRGGKWSYDAPAGRQEIYRRRIGRNELDAIEICRGYVEAQFDYAYEKRNGYDVNQYAQHIVSTAGKRDGLAWKNADGTWGGPIGEKVAQAIAQGYRLDADPYHGYFFKVLKGQGPDAPLGAMDFVVKGLMIGGFALAAAPAEYGETGLKTFIVSQAGVVYEKDLGPSTLEQFQKMELFNPDKTWSPVEDDE